MAQFDANAPDGMLIAAALAGEGEAFALLVARYQTALLNAARSRMGQRELAEEVVQETFLCAHRWLGTYDSQFSFRTWLWTILLNQCARQAKREARSQVKGQKTGIRSQPADRPLDLLLSRETSERLQELLSQLPLMQADALRLRFFGGLTFPEIAVAMGCSEAGAKHRVKHGLLKLGRWMKHPSDIARPALNESGDVL